MASSISAGTTSSTALVATADTSGALILQTNNGTTALTLSTAQNATFAGTLTTSSRGIAAASLPAGAVLQVVNATYSTETSSSSSTYADTGLTATITPTSASSKILILVSQVGVVKLSSDTGVGIRLIRGSTTIVQMESLSGANGTVVGNYIGAVSTNYLDSPATTSATTYKTQFNSYSNTASVKVQVGSVTSTITLMEIAV